MRQILILLFLSLSPAALAADAAEIERKLARAGELHAEALRLEHGWSTTQPLIDDARLALDRGDLEGAETLAGRALLTAEKSVEQAKVEREAWRERVIGD